MKSFGVNLVKNVGSLLSKISFSVPFDRILSGKMGVFYYFCAEPIEVISSFLFWRLITVGNYSDFRCSFGPEGSIVSLGVAAWSLVYSAAFLSLICSSLFSPSTFLGFFLCSAGL